MKENKKNLIWALMCPVIYMVVLWNLVPFVYGIVDDRSMMEIVSGQYLGIPDGHMIFTGYWYSWMVAGLYRLIPNVDWYAFCFLLLQAGCMGLIFYRMLSREKGRMRKIWMSGLLLLWCVILGLQTVAQVTFTTTAAVLAATVIFWYMTAEDFRMSDMAVLAILCFLAVELRFSVFCMILPVCAVLWIFRVWEEKGKNRIHLAVPLMVAGVLLLELFSQISGYGSKEWRIYTEYNNIRSLIYDYDDYMFPRYEDETELYNSLGIEDKSRAKNLYYYNYTADDKITSDFFGEYLDKRQEQVRERVQPVQRIKETIKQYIKGTIQGHYDYRHLAALIGYGFLILWCMLGKEWKTCLKTCCILGVQLVLWIYLIYRGRTPERVLISMNLMLIVPLLLMWQDVLSRRNLSVKTKRAGFGILLALLCVSACWYTIKVRQENQETSKWNQNVESLKEYCMAHPENFYFNDVTSMAMTTYNVHLWQQEPYVMNYMSLGDWMSFSPLWEEKLRQNGITSVKDALYNRDNVYLICSFDRGLEYLSELYEGVECTQVDKIHGFKIYRLEFL